MKPISLVIVNAHWDKDAGPVHQLLQEALEAARKEAHIHGAPLIVKEVWLHEALSGFFNPHNASLEVMKLGATLRDADGCLISSPIVGGSKPDCLQTLTSYLYRLEYPEFILRGKPFGVIVHGKEDGGREALLDISGPFEVDFDMVSPPGCKFYKIKDGAEHSEGQWMLKNHRMVGMNLVRYIAAMRTVTIDLNGWKLREAH